MGQALRLGMELVAGVAVGGFIGWALDRFLGTAPILMVVADAQSGKDLPHVPDDDDD
jgi:F0F1-type ATP synthase assembly protein I